MDILERLATVDNEVEDPDLLAHAAAEIERLSNALELIAAPMRPDGTWNRDRAACKELAEKALGLEPATQRIGPQRLRGWLDRVKE